MKKLLATALIFALLFSFTACGKKATKTGNDNVTQSPTDVSSIEKGSDYFESVDDTYTQIESSVFTKNDSSSNTTTSNVVSKGIDESITGQSNVTLPSSAISDSSAMPSVVSSSTSSVVSPVVSSAEPPNPEDLVDYGHKENSYSEFVKWLTSDKAKTENDGRFAKHIEEIKEINPVVPKQLTDYDTSSNLDIELGRFYMHFYMYEKGKNTPWLNYAIQPLSEERLAISKKYTSNHEYFKEVYVLDKQITDEANRLSYKNTLVKVKFADKEIECLLTEYTWSDIGIIFYNLSFVENGCLLNFQQKQVKFNPDVYKEISFTTIF